MSADGRQYVIGASVSAEGALETAARRVMRCSPAGFMLLMAMSSMHVASKHSGFSPAADTAAESMVVCRQKEELLEGLASKPKEEQDLPALQAQLGTIVADARAVLVRWAMHLLQEHFLQAEGVQQASVSSPM